MAKVSPGTTLPMSTIQYRLRGKLQITPFRGIMVAKAWPRKRGPKGTPAQMEARAAFTKMVRAVTDMMPEDKVAAMELAAGTAYTWRDVLSALVNGNLVDVPGIQMITTQAALDAITDTVGAMLVRTAEGWVGLAPGPDADVVTMADGAPAWRPPPSPGTPTPPGLFSWVLGNPPTIATTGLANWLNQGTASFADGSAGPVITAPSTGFSVRGRMKAATLTTYTALVSLSAIPASGASIGIGFHDGTNKMQLLQLNYAGGFLLLLGNYNTPTSYSGNAAAAGFWGTPQIWLRIQNTSTQAIYQLSANGVDWVTFSTITKSGSFLGATGFTNIVFFCTPQGTDCKATLEYWHE